MAKQPVNMVERHLEKGVLGICAAVALAAVALYLVSSPNKIDLGGEVVGAEAIDERVRDAGTKLRDKLRSAEASEVKVENFVPELEAASSPLASAGVAAEIPSPVPPLPRVPDIGDAVPKVGEIKLAKVIAPNQPIATKGRSSVLLVPPQPFAAGGKNVPPPVAGVFQTDLNWITVGALFDQQKQIAVCKKAGYKAGRRNPYLVGSDVQRREKLPDGTYGEWADVKAYLPLEPPPLPPVEIVAGRKGQYMATDATREKVRAYFDALRTIQAELFRPLFPSKKYGDDWLYPKFKDIDIPLLDEELCVSADAKCPPRPYPPQPDIVKAAPTAPKSDKERLDALRAEMERLFAAGQCDEAIAKADELLNDKAVTDADKKLASSRKAQMKQDKEQGRCKAKPDESHDEEGGSRARMSRFQVVWANDAAPPSEGGVTSGKTYQYRMRVRLYNRFCAVPADVADAKDAESVFVAGDWSDPTEDIYISPDMKFFLTSGNPGSQSGAKVTVFKWFQGVWVNATFAAEPGQALGGKSRQPVGKMADGQPDKPEIDFATGATVVDIDYDYQFRTKRNKGKGFTVDDPSPTVAMIYKDASGVLRQRVLEADRTSDEHKSYKERVFTLTGKQ